MSKKNKGVKTPKTAPTAPKVEEPKVETPKEQKTNEEPKVETPAVINDSQSDLMRQAAERGLDPNHRVDLMTLAHEYYHKDGGAVARKFGASQEFIDNIDHITMISIAAEYACEMTYSKTPFAAALRKNVLPEMQAALKELDITMPDEVLALPAKADGTVEVKSSEIKVPASVKKEIKETTEARNAQVETDPTKITSEKDLSNSLKHFIVNPSVFKGLNDAVNFYRSYLKLQAKDDEAKLKAIDAMTTRQLIAGIAKVTGICPFVTKGFGSYLLRLATEANSIVPAYTALFMAVKNKRTGNPDLSEEEVAEITAALIDWTANVRIAAKEANLKVLNKDAKKNKVAIDAINKDIESLKAAMNLSIDPSSDFADNLLTNLKSEDKKVAAAAKSAYTALQKAYYPEAGRGKTYVNMPQNIQQHAGIVTNLFRGPLAQIPEYNAGNLTELVEETKENADEKPAETPEKEEKPAEKSEEKPAEKTEEPKKEPKKAGDLGSRKPAKK